MMLFLEGKKRQTPAAGSQTTTKTYLILPFVGTNTVDKLALVTQMTMIVCLIRC